MRCHDDDDGRSGESLSIARASVAQWFDVRARYLHWIDGRAGADADRHRHHRAQAPRKHGAAAAGEGAGDEPAGDDGRDGVSVAHELNQPLTAITNYCNGMVSRIKNGGIDKDDLLAALREDRAAGRSAPARSSTASAPS